MNSKLFNLFCSHYNLRRFSRSSQLWQSLAFKEKNPYRYSPVLNHAYSVTFSRFNSNVASQSQSPKEHKVAIEVPELQFEDTPFDQPISEEELITALKKYNTLEDQMRCLVDTLSLSPEDVKRRWQFCKTIEFLLKPFFNDFKIQIFGSTVNSFGFKGCDIDMTFETTAQEKHRSFYLDRPEVPLVCEVLTGKVTRQELSQLPLKEQLVFLHQVFLEYYKDSEVPAKFINAHVPLVRFYHDKYNLKCDLTMKNKVAYANTKLLYLFSKVDKRVTPLMMAIRYWGKSVELIGKGLLFNTYTVTLLVIYFLQTRKPPILPSAEYILSLSDKFDIEDMHDKSFLDLLNSIPASENKESVEQLLKEFFFFYLYFDFTRVVCPLTASAVPRDDFFSKPENNRFRMNSMCVQDPLCPSHNVAELVDFKVCRNFVTKLMQICKIFQSHEALSTEVDLTEILKPDDVIKVFSKERAITLKIPQQKELMDSEVKSMAQTLLHVLEQGLLFDCAVLEFKQIMQLLEKHNEIVEMKRNTWREEIQSRQQRMEEAIPHLKNRYKRYPNLDAKEHNSTQPKVELSVSTEQFKKFYTINKLILCAQCQVSNNTWLGRDLVDISDESLSDLLAQERFISKSVAKQNAMNFSEQNPKPFTFLLECYVGPHSSNYFSVNLRPLKRASFNPILGIFLKEYIPKIMSKISS